MRNRLSAILLPCMLAILSMPLLVSCASPAAHYVGKPVTGYIDANDDADTTCVSPKLIPTSAADSVWARCEWTQGGALLKSDSLRVKRTTWVTFQPPLVIPTAAELLAKVILRDVGGSSCWASRPQIPSQVLVRPAALSGLSVVP
jgi:hypothetical protein